MSASPASPSSPERCSRHRRELRRRRCRRAPRARAGAPGRPSPERVAITRPSSGVKPIVVSTETPAATAASEAPAPRWHVTIRSTSTGRPASSAARARRRTRARARGSRSGGAPSARATRRAAHRSRPPAGIVRVERGVEARDRRHVRAAMPSPAASACERLRLVERREVGQRLEPARRPRRRSATGSTNSLPPWTMRWPTASTRRRAGVGDSLAHVRPATARLSDQTASSPSSSRELQAARPGVDDEDAQPLASAARPSRGSRAGPRPASRV